MENIENLEKVQENTDNSNYSCLGCGCLIVLILFFLGLEIDREYGHLKKIPALQMKTFHCYDNNYCYAEGSWDNTSYPNTSKINCDKLNKTCTIKTADILFDYLEINEEEFKIIGWDKNLITAEYSNGNYLFRLVLNLNSEDVTYTKYPIKSEIVPGWKTEQSSFKLIDGYEHKMKLENDSIKVLKWWNNPLLKIISKIKT